MGCCCCCCCRRRLRIQTVRSQLGRFEGVSCRRQTSSKKIPFSCRGEALVMYSLGLRIMTCASVMSTELERHHRHSCLFCSNRPFVDVLHSSSLSFELDQDHKTLVVLDNTQSYRTMARFAVAAAVLALVAVQHAEAFGVTKRTMGPSFRVSSTELFAEGSKIFSEKLSRGNTEGWSHCSCFLY